MTRFSATVWLCKGDVMGLGYHIFPRANAWRYLARMRNADRRQHRWRQRRVCATLVTDGWKMRTKTNWIVYDDPGPCCRESHDSLQIIHHLTLSSDVRFHGDLDLCIVCCRRSSAGIDHVLRESKRANWKCRQHSGSHVDRTMGGCGTRASLSIVWMAERVGDLIAIDWRIHCLSYWCVRLQFDRNLTITVAENQTRHWTPFKCWSFQLGDACNRSS